MRLVADCFAFCRDEVPRWNTISVSGYHIREAGSDAVQEVAFTLADGIAYVEAARDAGLAVDDFAPRISFFFNAHANLLEEVAKFRAARRLWARIMRERFGAQDPRSLMLRFHAQTGGSTLTAQQPLNNVVRTTVEALAAVLGGAQSLHTNGYDEALALPTEASAQLALRTQQILAHESGRRRRRRSAGRLLRRRGADRRDRDARRALHRRDRRRGGMVAAIEQGFPQREIERRAFEHQRAVEDRRRLVVGQNRARRRRGRARRADGAGQVALHHLDPAIDRGAAAHGWRVSASSATRRKPPRRWPPWRTPRRAPPTCCPPSWRRSRRAPRWARSPTRCGASSGNTGRRA